MIIIKGSAVKIFYEYKILLKNAKRIFNNMHFNSNIKLHNIQLKITFENILNSGAQRAEN
jgi:uncharacterized protein YpiB (UPF0302 family)